MKLKRLVIILIVVLVLFGYFFLFTMDAKGLPTRTTRSFSKDGFVSAEELNDTDKLVASNDRFELYIDETTSHICLVDGLSGETWRSNPVVEDPWEENPDRIMTRSAKEKQKSTLELTYFDESGSRSTINNYRMSIYHPETILEPEGERTFSIKYIENGVQILYEIEDREIDHLYFPKYLPKDVLEDMPERDLLEGLAYEGFDEDLDAYYITKYEDMSDIVKGRLYEIFYEQGDYTREQAIEENLSYGYTEQYEKIRFEIAIEVTLFEEGLDASVLAESIVEPKNVKLARVSLFPLFGTAVAIEDDEPTEGYIVLPDGTGAVIDFNNGKQHQKPYRKRLYGLDRSLLEYRMPEQQQKIAIPLFGMVKPKGGYAAIITEGDAMATIQADVSNRIDSYNKVFTSFEFRESESITLGSGPDRYGLDLWTEKRVDTDFTVRYTFLDADEASYVGIAGVYRDHLESEGRLIPTDRTDRTVLTTEFIGAYDKKDFFMGIPYRTTESMTTFTEAIEIIDMLEDIEHINVLYTGVFNGGLSSDLFDRARVERVLGGRSGYEAFEKELEEREIDLYPNIDLMTAFDYRRPFDQYRYTANRIKGSNAMDFNYHYPSRLPYSETNYEAKRDDYVINPLYYDAIFKRFTADFSGQRIAFSDLGSVLAGHYDTKRPVYQQDALTLQDELLASSSYEMMLTNPLGVAFPYAKYVVDLPSETTLYAIIDDQIPLLQLVFSGIVDYALESMNMSQERSVRHRFLKALETGSNIKYTLTYENSSVLLNTDYNYYMATHYPNWIDRIVAQVLEIDELGIHEGHLVDHERIDRNVYRVTYSHGLVLLINYNLSSIVYGDEVIDAVDYVVLEV
ncbi:MAG: DUF5696 domain-containing protein [Acholeplasmataceae bacterium]